MSAGWKLSAAMETERNKEREEEKREKECVREKERMVITAVDTIATERAKPRDSEESLGNPHFPQNHWIAVEHMPVLGGETGSL
jgi:hypothetical protein